MGSVQQGDSPLQLQSPVPGVTLPQYQPNPSLPATQPASAEANPGQHVSEPSAGTATGTAAAASTAAPAALALNLQPGGLTPEEPRKQDEAVQEQSSAPEGMPAAESRPQLQNVSSQEALDRQASICFLRSHVLLHMSAEKCMLMSDEISSNAGLHLKCCQSYATTCSR